MEPFATRDIGSEFSSSRTVTTTHAQSHTLLPLISCILLLQSFRSSADVGSLLECCCLWIVDVALLLGEAVAFRVAAAQVGTVDV